MLNLKTPFIRILEENSRKIGKYRPKEFCEIYNCLDALCVCILAVGDLY